MNVIFDLDGTLLFSKLRLHALFGNLVPQLSLSFDQYWQYKHSGMTNIDIIAKWAPCSEARKAEFSRHWMFLIEAEQYLAMDKLVPGVLDLLSDLCKTHELYVCTDRQFPDRTVKQLETLGVLDFFKEILVTRQKQSKASLIRESIFPLTPDDWFVGDTGKDVQSGQELGLKTCAVLNGFMSHDKLSLYQPSLVIPSVAEFRPDAC